MAEPASSPSRDRTRTRSRNTELGDRACFCSSCGWARRFYPGVVEPPSQCPDCEAPVVSACPGCEEDILSVMAVDCDLCGTALRRPENEAGVRIRRPKRLPVAGAAATVVPVSSAVPAPAAQSADCGCE